MRPLLLVLLIVAAACAADAPKPTPAAERDRAKHHADDVGSSTRLLAIEVEDLQRVADGLPPLRASQHNNMTRADAAALLAELKPKLEAAKRGKVAADAEAVRTKAASDQADAAAKAKP